MTATAAKLLDKIRYFGGIEWQVIHSSEYDALEELKAAGLVVESGAWVCPIRSKGGR